MNKNIKLKLIIAMTVLFTFMCLISAGFVIAQSAQADKKAANDKPAQVKPETPVKIETPKKTSKFFGTIGRPDPFIIVTGMGIKIPAGPGPGGTVKPGETSAEGAIGGAILTGTFIADGKKYALIKFGDKTYICTEGTEKMGFKVVKILSKKVTLLSKAGSIDLKLGDYSSKNQSSNNLQGPAFLTGESKSLVPPPMQPPVPAQSDIPGSSTDYESQQSKQAVKQQETKQ